MEHAKSQIHFFEMFFFILQKTNKNVPIAQGYKKETVLLHNKYFFPGLLSAFALLF